MLDLILTRIQKIEWLWSLALYAVWC